MENWSVGIRSRTMLLFPTVLQSVSDCNFGQCFWGLKLWLFLFQVSSCWNFQQIFTNEPRWQPLFSHSWEEMNWDLTCIEQNWAANMGICKLLEKNLLSEITAWKQKCSSILQVRVCSSHPLTYTPGKMQVSLDKFISVHKSIGNLYK